MEKTTYINIISILVFITVFSVFCWEMVDAEPLGRIEEESLQFKIDFLWFSDVAEGFIELKKENEASYKAVLIAETKGFIGWLTSYRKHIYISNLVLQDDKKGFISTKFERSVKINDNVESTLNFFDYKRHIFSWKEYRNGVMVREAVDKIPPNMIYEDVLSAFYNFRYGVYGSIEKGKEYKINTIPDRGVKEIFIHVATSKEEDSERKNISLPLYNNLLFIQVPKSIFNSKSGIIKVWFNSKNIPVAGIVEDYIGFGDIRGFLKY